MREKVLATFASISILCAFAALLSVGISVAHAASSDDFEISGWIPYWSGTQGIRDARRHLNELSVVHPFVYTIKSDGTLKDNANLGKSAWKRLFRDAKKKDVLVIPTIMTGDGALTHALLSDARRRKAHIEEIVDMVEDGDFGGVDIDYEAKLVRTKDYFSLFLKELKAALGKDKRLTCAIESRTPPDSLYRTVPANLEYANDLVAIGTHCDRVEIMAYDQRRADIKLNNLRLGTPYSPVADPDWVRKVIVLMSRSIPKEKLVLGIPTYGHEYEVVVSPNWFRAYNRIRAVNPDTALELAEQQDIEPSRNSAGEMSFTYRANPSSGLAARSSVPKGTSSGNMIAARALAYANATGQTTTFNFVTWSDAKAIEEKIALAQEYGLAGVALFKIDGREDPDVWDVIEEALGR